MYRIKTSKATQKQIIAANVRNKLRRCICINNYDLLFTKGAMRLSLQEMFMYKHYHGCSVNKLQSHLDLLLNQKGVYSNLFKNKGSKVITNAASTSCESNIIVLKPEYHKMYCEFILGKQIKRKVMESSSFVDRASLLAGRTLLLNAKEMLKYLKFANSHVLTLLDDHSQPLTSGWTMDDVIEYVLEFMYLREMKPTQKRDNAKDVDVEEEQFLNQCSHAKDDE